MSYEEIIQAQRRLASYIHRTPIHTSATLDRMSDRNLFFKCENFQKTGSFKARGALNAVFKLKESRREVPGVVTHSSGNHGQALAWAAHMAGIPCSVVVPRDTPAVKQEAIKEYSADLVLCEPSPQSRSDTCSRVSQETGRVFIPAGDHNDVISGQGTIAVELLEQVPDLDAILVPTSGGGMASGIAIATKHLNPKTKVFSVEPKGKDLEKCLTSGKRLWPDPPRFLDTIADAIRSQQIGHLNFPILCDLAEKQVFTVTDDEMIDAMKLVWQRMKLLIEVSSASGVAAALSTRMRQMDPTMRNIGVILCGGNVDINELPW